MGKPFPGEAGKSPPPEVHLSRDLHPGHVYNIGIATRTTGSITIFPDSGIGRLHARVDHPIGFSLEFNSGKTRLVDGERVIDLSDAAVVIDLVAGGVIFVKPTEDKDGIDYLDRILVTSHGYMNERFPTFLIGEASLQRRALYMADQAKQRKPN